MEPKTKKEPGLFEHLFEVWLPLSSILLCFLIEIFSRHSLMAAVRFVGANPAAFVFGCCVIYTTGRIAAFFPHRRFVSVLIGLIWLGLGVTSFVVGFFRVSPFSAMDLLLIPGVWKIFGKYLNILQMVLIAAALLICIALLVAAAIKSASMRVLFPRAMGFFLASVAVSACVLFAGIGTNAISFDIGTLREGYDNYGFVYGFGVSIFDRGIPEPDDYSEETVDEIAELIEDSDPMPLSGDDVHAANIIFLQLESFFDPSYVTDLRMSQNPIPNFTKLREECSSGFLRVPVMGAGTVNTEFEVITGMNIDYFGAGEYPYETILQASTCESLCFNLRPYGYTSHAIHDNDASFYKRNNVFSMLGFDTFTSIEFMENVKYNPLEWADDSVLTKYILKALESTEGPDMVFTVSVQPHGKYPDEYDGTWQRSIIASGVEEEMLPAWEYYLDQLRQEDEFLGELLAELEKLDEDTVLVVYGDHLPNLDISVSDLEYGSIYRTEYAIWSNFPIKVHNRDFDSYQLTAYVQSLLGMSSGEFAIMHQQLSRDPEYQDYLEELEYDVLYGDKILYNGETPYAPTNLQMGLKTISVTGAVNNEDGTCTITGSGFTPYSRVVINGHERSTQYINSTTLAINHPEPLTEQDTIVVAQFSDTDENLGQTAPYVP